MECKDCKCSECVKYSHCIRIPEKIQLQIQNKNPTGLFLKFLEDEQKRTEHIKHLKEKFERKDNYLLSELLEKVILEDTINIRDFLEIDPEKSKDASLIGNLYQSLWMVMILLDRVPNITSKYYEYFFGKIEDQNFRNNLTKKTDRHRILKTTNINMGNAVGVSDISLISKTNNNNSSEWACEMTKNEDEDKNQQLILISSKYYKKEKTLDKYDIDKIVEVMENHRRNGNTMNYNIILLVKNKLSLLKRMRSTTKKYILEDISKFHINLKSNSYNKKIKIESIYDLNDLENYILDLRNQYGSTYYQTVIDSCIGKPKNIKLIPKFHQLLLTNRTIDLIKLNQKLILLGCIARSGKTYTVGYIISKLKQEQYFETINKNKPIVILVITPAPTETIDQFTEDLFDKYYDFTDFIISKQIPKKPITQNTIIVLSKQFICGVGNQDSSDKSIKKKKETNKQYEERMRNTISTKLGVLNNKIVDLIVFDEIHFGGTTRLSLWILQALDPSFHKNIEHNWNGKIIKIFLTATYKKPVDIFDIKQNQLLTWGLDDIELCKYMSNEHARNQFIEHCTEKYGNNSDILVENTFTELKNMLNLTRQQLYTNIDKEYEKFPTLNVITSLFDTERLNEILANNENNYGFDFKYVFTLTSKTKDAQRNFQNIDSMNNLLEYIRKTMFNRIKNTFKQHKQDRQFYSQLWFLPYFEKNSIEDISNALKILMDTKFSKYCIHIATDGVDKNTVKKWEIDAFKEDKNGIIILVGKKFSLGISMPCVDVVMFLNNDHDVDTIYQRMFRALTESKNKKLGILVDLNPYRSITTLLQYTMPSHRTLVTKQNLLDETHKMIDKKLWLLDGDLFVPHDDNSKTYNELYTEVNKLIEKRYLLEEVNKTKYEVEKDFFGLFKRNYSLFKYFIKAKPTETTAILLESDIPPPNPPSDNDEDEEDDNERPVKIKDKPEIEDKEDNNDIIKTIISQALGDLIVIYALLLDDNENFRNMTFLGIIYKLYQKYKDLEYLEDKESNEDDIYDQLYNVLYTKFGAIIVNDSKNIKNITICKIITDTLYIIIDNSRENIISNNINSKYNTMKQHVQDIDNKDIAKVHAFVEEYLKPKSFEKKTIW
jgi:hypothetical protein